jgi:hypothetical protein
MDTGYWSGLRLALMDSGSRWRPLIDFTSRGLSLIGSAGRRLSLVDSAGCRLLPMNIIDRRSPLICSDGCWQSLMDSAGCGLPPMGSVDCGLPLMGSSSRRQLLISVTSRPRFGDDSHAHSWYIPTVERHSWVETSWKGSAEQELAVSDETDTRPKEMSYVYKYQLVS